MNEKPKKAEEMVLYAWVGAQDDPFAKTGKGEFGLKQGVVPAGTIPIVACKEEKVNTQDIVDQMKKWVGLTGIPRQLVRFKFDAVIGEINPV